MHKIVSQDLQKILISTFFVNLLSIIKNLTVARLLGPYFTGLCMSLLVIPQLAGYFDLGIVDSLIVTVPKYRGKGKNDIAEETQNKVFTFSSLISLIYIIGIIIWKIISPSETFLVGLHIFYATMLIPFMFITRYLCVMFAAERKFTQLAWVEFSYAFSLLITSLVFILLFQSFGFWIALIVSNAVVIFYYGRKYLKTWALRFVRFKLKEIIGFVPLGVTMLLSKAVYMPFIITAKIYIALVIGVEYVGYFLLGIIVISLFAVIPRAVARVTLPHLIHLNAVNIENKVFFRLFWRTQFYSFVLTLLASIIAYFAISPFVLHLLPKYAGGINIAKLMLLGVLAYSLIDNANNVLITLHEKRSCFIIIALSIFLQLFIFGILFLMDIQLIGVGISFIIVFAFYATMLNCKVVMLKKMMDSSPIVKK